jgi:hypothetical protein
MRAHVEQALSQGTSLAFVGGNPMFWQVRFEASGSSAADRIMVCYKDDEFSVPKHGFLDPFYSRFPLLNRRSNARVTTRWRLPPLGRPEQLVVGQMYGDWLTWDHLPYQQTMVIEGADLLPNFGPFAVSLLPGLAFSSC